MKVAKKFMEIGASKIHNDRQVYVVASRYLLQAGAPPRIIEQAIGRSWLTQVPRSCRQGVDHA